MDPSHPRRRRVVVPLILRERAQPPRPRRRRTVPSSPPPVDDLPTRPDVNREWHDRLELRLEAALEYDPNLNYAMIDMLLATITRGCSKLLPPHPTATELKFNELVVRGDAWVSILEGFLAGVGRNLSRKALWYARNHLDAVTSPRRNGSSEVYALLLRHLGDSQPVEQDDGR